MQEEQFQVWLGAGRAPIAGTVESGISDCKRVERSWGDLDAHYAAVGFACLMDRPTPKKPEHKVPIKRRPRPSTRLPSRPARPTGRRPRTLPGPASPRATAPTPRPSHRPGAGSARGTVRARVGAHGQAHARLLRGLPAVRRQPPPLRLGGRRRTLPISDGCRAPASRPESCRATGRSPIC